MCCATQFIQYFLQKWSRSLTNLMGSRKCILSLFLFCSCLFPCPESSSRTIHGFLRNYLRIFESSQNFSGLQALKHFRPGKQMTTKYFMVCLLLIPNIPATSGDTWSAALLNSASLPNFRTIVLLPKDRISKVQELQMTTVVGDNVGVVRGKQLLPQSAMSVLPAWNLSSQFRNCILRFFCKFANVRNPTTIRKDFNHCMMNR